MADFETTTDVDDCRVWSWFLAEIGGAANVEWGKDVKDFCRRISSENAVVFFHNLKFDAMFLLDHLLRSGYRWTPKESVPGTFTALIDKMGKFYQMKIIWSNGRKTEFFDSLKKLPFSVAAVSDAFDLPMIKGEIDYHKPRPIGYSPSVEELDYGFNDVLIVSAALKEQLEQGMTGMTVGSDSLREFKQLSGRSFFDRLFPVLPVSVDADIREAYRGGFTYPDPRFKGRLIEGEGSVYDVNSLYPYVMKERLLPYGEPQPFDGEPEVSDGYPLYIVSVTFTATIKPAHIPIIQIKSSPFFLDTEYLERIDEVTTMAFTSVEWEMIQEQYDVTVHAYNGGYRFRGAKGIFSKYIAKWNKVKEESDGGLRTIAKLHLNSLYGKFASNPDVTGKYPVLEDGIVKLKVGEEENREPVYTAMGAFITSYARQITVRAAQENFETFMYCDTDSLHLLTREPKGLDVDPSKLGAWKHEYDFTRAFIMRSKAYMEEHEDGTKTCRIAGLPEHLAANLDFGDLYDGKKVSGKLVPKTVPGGVVLIETDYTLKM